MVKNCPVHYRRFSSIAGLPDASSNTHTPTTVMTTKMTPDAAKCIWGKGTKLPPWRTTHVDREKKRSADLRPGYAKVYREDGEKQQGGLTRHGQ